MRSNKTDYWAVRLLLYKLVKVMVCVSSWAMRWLVDIHRLSRFIFHNTYNGIIG